MFKPNKKIKTTDNRITEIDIKTEEDNLIGNDFHKVDTNGVLLESNAPQWFGVYDKKYALYWESKTQDGGLRDYRKHYRWGGKGVIIKEEISFLSWLFKKNDKVEQYDDWNALVDQANREKLCGFNDWRVPTQLELKTLTTHHSHNRESSITWSSDFDHNIYIDPAYFPLMTKLEKPCFWSCNSDTADSNRAWGVNHFIPIDGNCNGYFERSYADSVRLVRSNNKPKL